MGSCASPVNRQLSNHKSRTAFQTAWLISLRNCWALGYCSIHGWGKCTTLEWDQPKLAGWHGWGTGSRVLASLFFFFPHVHLKGTEEFYRYYVQHETHFLSVECIWKSNVEAVQLLPSSTTAVWEGVCWVHHLLVAAWLEINYPIHLN